MREIWFGVFISLSINSAVTLINNGDDMVDIAIVEEKFAMTEAPELVKGGHKKMKTKTPEGDPEIGTGVPDELDFEVKIASSDPVVLHLKRSKGRYELKDILIPEENSEKGLMRMDAPVDEGFALYYDLDNGGVFTCNCKGISHGECDPYLKGSFFHEGSEYDIEPITEKSPERVKRQARQHLREQRRQERLKLREQRRQERLQRKQSLTEQRRQERLQRKLSAQERRKQRKEERERAKKNRKQRRLERKRVRQLRKSLRKKERAEKKRSRKLYAVMKRKKDKPSFNDYSRKKLRRKFRNKKQLSKIERLKERERRKRLRQQLRRNRKQKGQTDKQGFEFIELGTAESNALPFDVGSPEAVQTVARMVDSQGTKVMQTSREITPTAVNKTTADMKYSVEILVALDFSIYTRFLESSEKATPEDRDVDAKTNIRRYFAHIMNGIDLRYRQIVRPDYAVKVGVIGYIIIDTPAKSWVTTGAPIQPRVPVNASRVLENMLLWKGSLKDLPFHDHLMLFTSHDLYQTVNRDGVFFDDTGVAGLAFIGSTCGIGAVSVCEDIGDFGGVNTGTHELGHGLGALHDGFGNISSECSPSDHYIMSPKFGITTERTKLNPFKFSSCSIDSFTNHFEFLNNNSANCLKNEIIIFMESEYNETISEMPGQILDPFEQCRIKLGVDSFYGWGGTLGELNEICTRMACKKPETATQYNIYSAARGTSCGNKKWCVSGICTESPDAPEMDENCMYNDSLRLINGLTCKENIDDYPGNCYLPFYASQCCDSCRKAVNTSFPAGCEWGDQTPACDEIHNDTGLCYENEKLCCLTCLQYETGFAHCKYGDKWTNCDVSKCSNRTYAESCCKTCGLLTAPLPLSSTTTTTTTTTAPTTTTTTVALTTPPSTKYCVNGEHSMLGVSCWQLAQAFKNWGRDICLMAQFSECCTDLSVCSTLHPSDCKSTATQNTCRCTCKPQESNFPGCKESPLCSNILSAVECSGIVKSICSCTCNALEIGAIPPRCTEQSSCSSKHTLDCISDSQTRQSCPCSCRVREAFYLGCWQLSSCIKLKQSECYKQSARHYCGCSCRTMHSGNPNCPYGDQLDECELYSRLYPAWFCDSYKHYCCKSCNGTTIVTTGGTPPAQAVRKIQVAIDALSDTILPSQLTLVKPLTPSANPTTTVKPTEKPKITIPQSRKKSFQELLQERKERRRKLLEQRRKAKHNQQGSNANNSNSRLQRMLELRKRMRDAKRNFSGRRFQGRR